MLFVGVAACIWLVAYVVYLVEMRRQKNEPSLAFWFIMWLVDIFTIIALVSRGVGGSDLTQILVWTSGTSVVLFVVLRHHGKLTLLREEIWCLVLAMLGMGCWKLAGDSNWALVFEMSAMVVATIPFWRVALGGKESPRFGSLALLGSLACLGTVSSWSLAHWEVPAIPVFGTIHAAFTLFLILLGKRRAVRVSG